MANSIMKSLALTFEGAIALGVGIKIGQTAGSSRIQEEEPSNDLALEPVLERLESMESRVLQAESALSQSPALPEVALPDIGFLHQHLVTYEQELKDLRNDPRTIDERSNQNLERKLQAEFREMQDRAIEMFVHTIDTKIVSRISRLEQNVLEHSDAISTLRQKSIKTDENLQRLLMTVERLCNRFPAQTTTADTRSVA